MGRETKLLLALLGLLAGVFLGVVSMKLFVPRPPEGAGPDVHGEIAAVEAQALVEPPELGPPPALADTPAVAPPPATEAPPALAEPAPPPRASRFGGDVAAAPRDPFVVPASFEPPAAADTPPAEAESLPPTGLLQPAPPPDLEPASPREPPPAAEPPAPARFEPLPPGPMAPVPGETYVTQPGDSWWSLAERAYGDGRLYRALFAWNRRLDPRVSLSPGTRLELPPAAQLGAAWPGLMPRD